MSIHEIIYYMLKVIVFMLCGICVITSIYSASISFKSNFSNTSDYAGAAMAIFYVGFDSSGITIGPEDLDKAIVLKALGIMFVLFIIKTSLRNARQIKELVRERRVGNVVYDGFDKRQRSHN
jgi:hypothetical protein